MPVADLIIRLRDQASQGLGRIGGAIAGLGGRAGKAAATTQSLAGSIRDGVLQANAVTFALGKAQQAVGFLNGKFEEAKNLQLEQINAATTFSALTGQSSEQAARFIENLNDSLAKSAATLPGATQDYKALAIAVQDNVLEAFKDPSGKLNQKEFEKTLISMSESFGALTAASTKDIGNTSLGLSKALAGGSISELRQIAFFEQNPVILNALEKELTAQGKQLKDLNIKDRVKLIEKIGKQFITEDFKKKAAESVDGLLQSFQSTLFDPSAGVFGIMRDLDPATDGVQSAFSSMNQALIELIGPTGVVFQLADILAAAGIELPDPMRLLKTGIDFAVGGLKRLNRGLGYIKDFLKAGGSLFDGFRLAAGLLMPRNFSIKDRLSEFMFSLGERLGGFIGGLAAQVVPLFNRGAQLIGEFFQDTERFTRAGHQIGVAFGALVGRVTGAVLSFLAQVDYAQLLQGLGRGVLSVAGFLVGAIAGAVGGAAVAVAPGALTLIQSLNQTYLDWMGTFWLAIRQTVVDGLNLLSQVVGPTLGRIPLIGPAIAGVMNFQIGAWSALVSGGIGGLFGYLMGGAVRLNGIVQSTGQLLLGGMALLAQSFLGPLGQIPIIGTAIGAFITFQLNAFEALITGGIGGLFSFIVSTGQALVAALQQRLAGLVEQARAIPVIGNLIPPSPPPTQAATVGAPIAVGSRYSGQIGWAAGGFLGNLINAAKQEISRMPAGANLMLANSSETILPQGMLGMAVRALMPTAMTAAPSGSAPNITIHINGANSDPQQIAAEVISRIQALFDQEGSAQLV